MAAAAESNSFWGLPSQSKASVPKMAKRSVSQNYIGFGDTFKRIPSFCVVIILGANMMSKRAKKAHLANFVLHGQSCGRR